MRIHRLRVPQDILTAYVNKQGEKTYCQTKTKEVKDQDHSQKSKLKTCELSLYGLLIDTMDVGEHYQISNVCNRIYFEKRT